jgi:hypothetical protein
MMSILETSKAALVSVLGNRARSIYSAQAFLVMARVLDRRPIFRK